MICHLSRLYPFFSETFPNSPNFHRSFHFFSEKHGLSFPLMHFYIDQWRMFVYDSTQMITIIIIANGGKGDDGCQH